MPIDPTRTRLKLPSAYGAPSDSPLMNWSSADERLQQAEHYWLSTADSNAIPISRPLDGVWLDLAFYFGGDPDDSMAKKSRGEFSCVPVLR